MLYALVDIYTYIHVHTLPNANKTAGEKELIELLKILQWKETIKKFMDRSREGLLYTYDTFNTLVDDMQI